MLEKLSKCWIINEPKSKEEKYCLNVIWHVLHHKKGINFFLVKYFHVIKKTIKLMEFLIGFNCKKVYIYVWYQELFNHMLKMNLMVKHEHW